jgi:diguanylate cyclase (GGDEF)-like protein/PAS domain S-box-containing protein
MPFSRFDLFFIALSWGFFSLATAPLVFASESQKTSSELNTPFTQTMDQNGSSWLLNPNNFEIELNYDSYSVAEGLSQSIVTSIVEDNEGYVWIGTLNGLNRFDGTDFKHFFADNNSGLPSSFIRSLLIDQQGRLLVGTDAGLAVYDNSKESFKAWTNQGVSLTEPIWALDKSENHVFIGLNKKVLILNKDNVESFKSDKFKEIKKIKSNENLLFIRNYDGDILKIEDGKVEKIFSSSIDIELLLGELFITSNEGLYIYKGGNLKKISNKKHSLIVSVDGELISRVEDKLLLTNQNTLENDIGKIPNKNNSYSNSLITASKNNIFITFMNKGFIKINRDKNISSKPSEIQGNIWSIAHDENNIYIASDSISIQVYSHSLKFKKEVITSASFGAKNIAVINGYLFVGSSTGLIKVNVETGSHLTLSNENISHLSVNDNILIAASEKGDVMLINEHSEIFEKFKLDSNYPIYDILIDDKKIWIASQTGLTLKENNSLTSIYSEDIVTDIEKIDDTIFFGTRTALYSLNTAGLKKTKLYSNNKVIYSIIHDNGKLITSSSDEVNVYNIKTNKSTTLNSENGIQVDYNLRSALFFKKSWVFGGTDGLSIIRNDLLKTISKKIKPNTTIASFSLFNTIQSVENSFIKKPINLLNEISLKFTDYPFSFKFIVPGKSLDEVDFLYQMQGLSNDWLPAKEVNSATYTNLSHGEYFFNVYAIDKLTGQQGPTKSIKVIITPPWWLSLQAKFIYALLTLIFTAAFSRELLRRRAVQKQIALSEERLKLSLWGSGDEMWDWDIQSGNIYRSNIWGTLDFPQDGQRSGELGSESNIHPQDQARVQAALEAHFKGETNHFEIAYRVKDRNNNWLWILDRAKIVERDNNERPLRMTGTIKDINSIKQTEEQLRLFARAIENISEGMFILDASYQFVEVNSACCELLLQEKSTFQGEMLNFSLYPESFSIQIRQLIKQQGYWSGEIEAARADNSQFLMSLAIDSIKDEQGEISHYVGVFSDITRRKQQEEELRKLTNNDILTGLPNRSSLQVTLSNLVKKDIHHTLMVLDLDNFKRINDSLGHQVGDDLLIQVAQRIETTIPSQASLYRLGGDEFAILLDNNPDIGSSAAIATNVIEALKNSFDVQNEHMVIGLSIGIVLYPEDEQNEQALLRKADIAMYHAKSGGGNRYQFYSESLNQNVLRQLEVENLIREGLRDDLFEVYYQAKVDLKRDRVTGMEALVRLKHPVHGLIPPNDFIPLAEENGLIIEIGDIVLRKACTAAQKWREQGIFNGRIAVNLSSKQFALPDLVQRIESILRLTQLPAENLELEITEGTVIKNPESAIKVMQQLTRMGISLALDDFGTGYSSLSYLKRFPIHRLKVDKSFIDDIDKSDMDLKMVDSIITIAHNMGLTVVGEGVEQTSQLAILRALNCEEIQGYIFSKPVPESDFTAQLAINFHKDNVTNSIDLDLNE